MKACDMWEGAEDRCGKCKISRSVCYMVDDSLACKLLREDGWRAALEHVLKMKISSAHCKTELDVLRDWIKQELEDK